MANLVTDRLRRWISYAACAWAVFFAAPHIWWALGNAGAFPGGKASYQAFMSSSYMHLFNLTVIALCGTAVVLTLRLLRAGDEEPRRRVPRAAMWIANGALTLRGVAWASWTRSSWAGTPTRRVRAFDRWPYDKPVVVLASSPLEIPRELRGSVEWLSGSPAEIVARLSDRGIGNVHVDGGATIQRFLAAGALARLIITRVPVLIGRGVPLFGPVPDDIHLQHIETRQFPSGVVQSEYGVRAPRAGVE